MILLSIRSRRTVREKSGNEWITSFEGILETIKEIRLTIMKFGERADIINIFFTNRTRAVRFSETLGLDKTKIRDTVIREFFDEQVNRLLYTNGLLKV